MNFQEDVIEHCVVDKLINCSLKEFSEVLKNWDRVMEKADEISTEIGSKFLIDNPQYKGIFPTLANEDDNNLVNNKDFLTHSLAILRGLDSVMQNLSGKYEEENELLPIISRTHARRGVTCKMMYELKRAVVQSCFQILDLPQKEKSSWDSVLDFIFKNFACAAFSEEEKLSAFTSEEEDYF